VVQMLASDACHVKYLYHCVLAQSSNVPRTLSLTPHKGTSLLCSIGDISELGWHGDTESVQKRTEGTWLRAGVLAAGRVARWRRDERVLVLAGDGGEEKL